MQTCFFDLMDGGDEKVSDEELADCPSFSPAEDLKNERDFLGVYISGHPLQGCRRVISEVATFKTVQLNDPDVVDALLAKMPEDKWKKKGNPHLKDPRALRHLDVRLVGILSACTVKAGKPRPDGTPGQKWAILQLDDGNVLDCFCFPKAWQQFGARVETAVDKLVLLCGEVSHRINYEKDDRFEKKHPTVGDLNFTVKEAYPIEDALPLLSKGLRITMQYTDPEIKQKVDGIRAAIKKNPGTLPVIIELHYPNGRVLDVSLGAEFCVAGSISFLSELSKIVPQATTTFRPSDKVYLAPREPRRSEEHTSELQSPDNIRMPSSAWREHNV